MNNLEWADSNALCCCEYYNIEEERSHILGCCCNCVDLDEHFESLITGERISAHRNSRLMATIQDRIRIPWRGGAKQISPDTLIPVILVPLSILLAAYDLILTILVFLLVPLFLNHSFYWFKVNHPKTKFFVMWTIMSFIVIAFIFEIKVIALLEILPEENIALGILTGLFMFCAYRTKITAYRLQINNSQPAVIDNDEENQINIIKDVVTFDEDDFCINCKRKQSERVYHCNLCQCCIIERDFHFIWFDCCIGSSNNGMFLLSILLGIATLLYSANLTLTTVCHPIAVLWTIMLPDDCSEVYEQYDMSLCFTSAIYSILIAIYLIYIFLRQILIISLGMTGQEWQQLSCSKKLYCGLNNINPYNQGFIRNWFRIFCLHNNKYGKIISTINT